MLCIHMILTAAFLAQCLCASSALKDFKKTIEARKRTADQMAAAGVKWAYTYYCDPPKFEDAIRSGDIENICKKRAAGQKPTYFDIQAAASHESPKVLSALIDGLGYDNNGLLLEQKSDLLVSCLSKDRIFDPEGLSRTRILLDNCVRPAFINLYAFITIKDYRALEVSLPKFPDEIIPYITKFALEKETEARVLSALLQRGMDPDDEEIVPSPLSLTIVNMDYEKAKLLLEAGASPNGKTSKDLLLIEEALNHHNSIDLVFLLLRHGAVVPSKAYQTISDEKLRWLAFSGHIHRFLCVYQWAMEQGVPSDVIKKIFSIMA